MKLFKPLDSHIEKVLIALSFVTLFIIAFGGGGHSLWLDEAYSIYVAEQSWEGIKVTLKQSSNPPLYHLFLKFWTFLFGDGEWAMRNLSGVFYMLAALGVYKIGGATFNDKRTAFLAFILFLSSFIIAKHTHLVRMYTLLVCIEAWTILLFIRLFYQQRKRISVWEWTAWILLNTMGCLTHYWHVFVMVAQFIAYFSYCSKQRWKAFLFAFLLPISGFLPLWSDVFLFQLQQNTGTNSYLGYANYKDFIKSFIFFYAEENRPLGFAIYGMFALAVAVSIFSVKNGMDSVKAFWKNKTNQLLILLLSVIALLPFLATQFSPIYSYSRHTIISVVPLALVLSGILTQLARKHFVSAIAFVMLALCLAKHIRKQNAVIPSSKNTVQRLSLQAKQGDVLIYTSLSGLTLQHYLKKTDLANLKQVYFPREIEKHPAWRNVKEMLSRKPELEREAANLTLQLEGQLKNGDKVWMFYGRDLPISGMLKQQLDQHFTLTETNKWVSSFAPEVLVYEK